MEGVEDWDTDFYVNDYSTISAAREKNSAQVALEIAEEGITLLKNDNVLPLAKGSGVTPFGLRYLDPVYGGTGSGNVSVRMSYIDTPQEVFNEYFSIDPLVESKLESGTHYYLPAPEEAGVAAGGWQSEKPKTVSATLFENHSWMDELNPSEVYDFEYLNAARGTVGIVFIGRTGGESNDVYNGKNGPYADGASHELQLNEYEKETIRIAKESCGKVIAVLETSNIIEIDELAASDGDLSVDAIVWMGGAGAKGFRGLTRILSGEVNPSGHLPDTWMTSIADNPVSLNHGEFLYKNLTYNGITQSMVEYDEGIYVGYRYYETVHDLKGYFSVRGEALGYGTLTANGSIKETGAVLYPFGYGLSYTDFSQEIESIEETETDVKVTVVVRNNGTVAGKDAVQVYFKPPYTKLDIENRIEKSTVNLIAYGKTGLIPENGGSETLELSFPKEDMASYSYMRSNPNGTRGCYMLEKGEYEISLRGNSHEVLGLGTVNVESTTWYDGSNKDLIRQSEIDAQNSAGGGSLVYNYRAATNQFEESNEHMAGKTDILTRADGSLSNNVESPTVEDLTAPDDLIENVNTLEFFDPETDPLLGNVKGSLIYEEKAPQSGASRDLTLADIRGVPYDDPKWDALLNQLDLTESSDVWQTLLSSAYAVGAIESVGKPATSEADGPQGISSMYGNPNDNGNAWCSAPILAATFNEDLAFRMGAAVGQEALADGISAWYAPGMNIHRSPFSGRNFEYYSEDPVLTGYMASRVVSGAADYGLACVIKHLFLNDQETNREHLNTWADEQTMREIYLKPFEIAIKKSFTDLKYIADTQGTVKTRTQRACTGIMTSMGNLGSSYCGTNYNLATNVLRGEMGFRGMIMTDMAENPNNSRDKMIRSGVDLYMYFKPAEMDSLADPASPTAQNAMRNAVKNVSYMVANNGAMQGVAPGASVSYTTSPWVIWLWVANIVIYVFVIFMAVVMVLRSRDAKHNPQKYKK